MLQAGLELMGENIGLQATCCFSGREHPVLWGFRPILSPVMAQRLVAGIRQYDPPLLVPLSLGYPQEPHPRWSVGLDVCKLQSCKFGCPHSIPVQGEEEGFSLSNDWQHGEIQMSVGYQHCVGSH